MTPPDLETIWLRIAADVRDAIGEPTYDVWIAPLTPVSFDGRELLLSAPRASGTWAADRFGRVLQASAEAVLGHGVVTRITSAPVASGGPDAGADPEPVEDVLNPKFSFDQFVLGPANRFAHACALAVAENPGTAYNPLFLCGPPGVGKTHLLHSVADYLKRHEPSLRVRLTTAEGFVNEFVAAVRTGHTQAFKSRYRFNDVLLVDDVQFLMSKTHTEEEFFHTFNALRDGGAQVMLTSDRAPRDLANLQQRLRDRFESGLVAQIGAPDSATRFAVLRKRAAHDDLPLPADSVLEVIAERVTGNLRALEGALIRIVAFSSLTGRPADENLAREVLDELLPEQRPAASAPRVTIDSVQDAACSAFGITREELVSPSKQARLAWPRQLAMYLAREHTGESLPAIGQRFGGRGHTTVLHACRRTRQKVASDPEASALVDELSTRLLGRQDDRA